MMFKGLKSQCRDERAFYQRQLELGLDVIVNLPPRPPHVINDHYNLHGLPVSYHAGVAVSEHIEVLPDESMPLLVKEYHTPAGMLRTEVRQTADWRWGDHVPFLDDYIIPRARKPLVTRAADLDALRYLLIPPTAEECRAFHAESLPMIQFAKEQGLALSAGWGVGADMLGWLCGLENMVFLSYDQPDFLAELLGLIADWNRKRMAVVLSKPVDLFIKRAWYENCDFFTPDNWRKFIQPILKADVEAAHQAGVMFGYIITSNAMPLLEAIMACGVDVLIGVDPHQYDLQQATDMAAGKMCLWGGVNGHLTVEQGRPDEVRAEVSRAMRIARSRGGFILSPVDNVRQWSPIIESNVKALIAAWGALV